MKNLPYLIVRIDSEDENVLAAFANEYDRDLCLDTLREEFPDCELDGQDD